MSELSVICRSEVFWYPKIALSFDSSMGSINLPSADIEILGGVFNDMQLVVLTGSGSQRAVMRPLS